MIDFLLFYKLLIITCKLCVAKHDEALITKSIKTCQDKQDVLQGQIDSISMKSKNLEMILPTVGDGNDPVQKELADRMERLTTGLKENSQQLIAQITEAE